MVNIIGISGLAGSGKDTTADYLVEHRSFAKVALADPLKRYCMNAFAFTEEQLWGPSKFRNAIDERYPRPKHTWPETEVLRDRRWHCLCCGKVWDEDGNGQCYLTPRFALQKLGTEWGRDCYPNVWVDCAIRTARGLLKANIDQVPVIYDRVLGIDQDHDYDPCPYRGVVISDVRFKNEIDAIRKAGGTLVRVVRGTGLGGEAGKHASEAEMSEIPDSEFNVMIENSGTLDELREMILGVL